MSIARYVAVLVGSLRSASISRRFALASPALAPPALWLDIVDIGLMPLYNEDLEKNAPAVVRKYSASSDWLPPARIELCGHRCEGVFMVQTSEHGLTVNRDVLGETVS